MRPVQICGGGTKPICASVACDARAPPPPLPGNTVARRMPTSCACAAAAAAPLPPPPPPPLDFTTSTKSRGKGI
ncbi:hypothetical protein JYU34_016217 [Plutella xylostella]|uniref:Uncharacterized protein n=1 Tax=Plutella xylostella TaxID=51655 RepID=A0ABQ7Q244_PLUXY|nr:hypothetical protein JYU34_016217 [Plutella xylostella]